MSEDSIPLADLVREVVTEPSPHLAVRFAELGQDESWGGKRPVIAPTGLVSPQLVRKKFKSGADRR